MVIGFSAFQPACPRARAGASSDDAPRAANLRRCKAMLLPVPDHSVEAPRACARGGDVEEHEAVERGKLAAIENGIEAPWDMRIEIGDGAHAGGDEGGGPRQQADHQKGTGDQLDDSRVAG